MEFAAHLDGSFLLFFFHMYHIYDPSPDIILLNSAPGPVD